MGVALYSHGCSSVFSWVQLCILMGAALYSHGCSSVFSWVQLCILMGAALYSHGCSSVFSWVQLCILMGVALYSQTLATPSPSPQDTCPCCCLGQCSTSSIGGSWRFVSWSAR